MKISESRHHSSKPKNPTFPELSQNNVRFFSSARHNYIVRNITKQRKTKKIKDENLNWHSSLRKLPKKTFSSGVQWHSSIFVFVFVFAFVFLYSRLYFCNCISCLFLCISVFLPFCIVLFLLCSRLTRERLLSDIHSKSDSVCGFRLFSLQNSAEKVRKSRRQNFATKARNSTIIWKIN